MELPSLTLFCFGFSVQSVTMLTSIVSEVGPNLPGHFIKQFINGSYADHYGSNPSSGTLTTLWSFTVAIYTIGKLISCFFSPYVADRFGRRQALFLWTNVFSIIGCTCIIVSKSLGTFELLMFGRLVTGISSGMANIILPIYMTETSPVAFRGFMSVMRAFLAYFINVVIVVLAFPYALGTEELWPYLLGLPVIPCLLQIMGMFLYPESPSFDLLNRMDRHRSSATIRKYFGLDGSSPSRVEDTLGNIEKQQNATDKATINLVTIWRSNSLRLGVFISVVIGILRAVDGHYALTSYSSAILIKAGLSESVADYSTLFIAFFSSMACLVVMFLVEKMGRRPLILYPSAIGIFAWIGLSFGDLFGTQWASYVSVAAIFCFVIVIPFVSSVGYFVGSELVPQNARSLCSSLQMILLSSSAFVELFLLPVMEEVIGGWTYIIMFAIPLACIFLILFFLLPETKQKPIHLILEDLEKRGFLSSCAGTNWDAEISDISESDFEKKPLIDSNGGDLVGSYKSLSGPEVDIFQSTKNFRTSADELTADSADKPKFIV